MMYLETQEQMYNRIYERLIGYFPNRPWEPLYLKHGKNLAHYKLFENLISYGLYLYKLKDLQDHDLYDRGIIVDAMINTAKLIELYESMPADKRETFIGRWGAAFCNANDMRALTFEVFVSNTLKSYGWSIQHKDDDKLKETYDFLASKDNKELQIECKSFSYDKGLIISFSDAEKLAEKILTSQVIKNNDLKNEACFVTIRINKKLSRNEDISNIYNEINNELIKAVNFSSETFDISIDRYENVDDIQEDFPRVLLSKFDDVELAHIHTLPEGNNSRIFLRIATVVSDAFWREFERVCRQAAKNQLNKDKASVLVIQISNLDLRREVLENPRFIAKMKSIFEYHHLVGMLLVSNTSAYEDSNYPYFYVAPAFNEFFNSDSNFKLDGNYLLIPKE